MGDIEVPIWLKSLPLAPEYRPTETEFADPIAFISKIEKEASEFGICKVIPPLPKPSKSFVFSNLNRSLSKSPELGPDANSGNFTNSPGNAVFTTRHQELGSRRTKLADHKQVWQSGEVYTLEQFETKSKAFARTQLGHIKDVSPLIVEALFWKAAAEKPIYIEYANDVPGSGFGVPEEPFRYYSHRRRRKRKFDRGSQNMIHGTVGKSCDNVSQLPDRPQKSSGSGSDREGTAGWKLSNSPWNLQVIARSPGSLTRFMPDEVPGVTSPMIYIGMMFSWFAWHVEDHELHSLNFLHTGSPKTWYSVPGSYASTMEEVVRVQGFGGNIDRLAAFTMLGEKTTLLSPEVVVTSGIPCCRLVQNPGEFVVTFPRAYHVGFSHGFNCGEAANFATPEWLKVAKEAAVRRAAMNYLPMLSHQQLLYMLTMSFVSRVLRSFLPGARSSRLRDRKKEEREILIKKAFLDDMMSENHILNVLLGNESTFHAVLWHPDLLPSPSNGSQSLPLSVDECIKETVQCNVEDKKLFDCKEDDCLVENVLHEVPGNVTKVPFQTISSAEIQNDENLDNSTVNHTISCVETMESLYFDGSDLSCGLDVDSGTLACVACGILGYPFMSIVQPSDTASKELLPTDCVMDEKIGNSKSLKPSVSSCLTGVFKDSDSDNAKEVGDKFDVHGDQNENKMDVMANMKLEKTHPCHQIGASSTGTLNHVISQSTEDFPVSNSSPIISTDEGGQDHSMMPVGHESYLFSSAIENTKLACKKDTKIDNSDGIYPSDGLNTFVRSTCTEVNETAERSSESSAVVEGGEHCCKTGMLLGELVGEGSEDLIPKWNTSNGFLRPRIFCLQHALEIEKLLRHKGGANVLIICHSDYLKIKGQAVSVAEEIGAQFNCNDVPMKKASQADLDLVNRSIDDDEHEECGKDWTSKLGVNLRYCVKLRKQSSSKPERLTLSLGGIFSDPVPLSVVSSLRWQCRKSRTHHKASTPRQTNMQVVRNLLGDPFKEIQASENCEGEPSAISRPMKHRGRPRKKSPKELGSSNDTAIADETGHIDDGKSPSGYINEELGNIHAELANLPSVPISAPENSETHHGSLAAQEINTTFEVSVSEKPEDFPRSAFPSVENSKQVEIQAEGVTNAVDKICSFAFDSSIIHQNMPSTEESSMKCEFGGSAESEVQSTTGSPLVEHKKFGVLIKTYFKRKSGKSVKPCGETNTSVPKVVCSEVSQDALVAAKTAGNVGKSDMVENQPTMSVPMVSEVRQQIITAEKTTTEGNVSNSSKSEGLPTTRILMADGTEMQQDFQTAEEPSTTTELEVLSTISSSSVTCCKMQEGKMVVEESSMKTKFANSLESAPTGISASEGSEMHLLIHTAEEENATLVNVCSLKDAAEMDNGQPSVSDSKPPEKQRNKRKREVDQITSFQFSRSGFIHGPCEGLRPRTQCAASHRSDNGTVEEFSKVRMRSDGSIRRRDKDKDNGSYKCGFVGCHMSFRTKGELLLHKRNQCTYEGCGKRFRSHEYAVRHQRVHTDERPLKCPWKGCSMSFKWAWARTEHLRVHTGERPYKCKITGCGLTFRFVSDFSRHRRKTGHYVN